MSEDSSFDIECADQAAEVYFARFEREFSGASCAGLFGDELDNALLLPFEYIAVTASYNLRLPEMDAEPMSSRSPRDGWRWK